MVSGAALKDLSLLARFFVIAFADLKKYHYYYWFAFPSFATELMTISKAETIKEAWTEGQVQQWLIVSHLQVGEFVTFCGSHEEGGYRNTPFFLVKFSPDGMSLFANYLSHL